MARQPAPLALYKAGMALCEDGSPRRWPSRPRLGAEGLVEQGRRRRGGPARASDTGSLQCQGLMQPSLQMPRSHAAKSANAKVSHSQVCKCQGLMQPSLQCQGLMQPSLPHTSQARVCRAAHSRTACMECPQRATVFLIFRDPTRGPGYGWAADPASVNTLSLRM